MCEPHFVLPLLPPSTSSTFPLYIQHAWTQTRHEGCKKTQKVQGRETYTDTSRERVSAINRAYKGTSASRVLLSIFKIPFCDFRLVASLCRVNHFACTHLNIKIVFNHQSQWASCIFISSYPLPPSIPPSPGSQVHYSAAQPLATSLITQFTHTD